MNNLTIVMYHYVRDLKNTRYPGIKGLDIDLFKEQVNYLRKHYHVITMEEVIFSIDNQAKIPDKSVLLTFDDAYADHYENVFPILDKYKLQGSFYAPAKAVTEHIVLDVNKIHFILASVDKKSLVVDDLKNLIEAYKEEYQLEDFETYYRRLAHAFNFDSKEVIFIKRLLQVELVEKLRTKIINTLFEKYIGINEHDFSKKLYMSEEQLMHMLGRGHHIGNHGYNHYWWNSLNKEEMIEEIELSTKFLKKIGVDMNNWTACYPYGSFDDQSIQILEKKGCKLALTTEVAIASTNQDMRFVMPRIDTNHLPKDSNAITNDWYLKG